MGGVWCRGSEGEILVKLFLLGRERELAGCDWLGGGGW